MLDTPSNPTDPEAGSTPSLSWQERELVGALKRLANARSQYASLKAESEVPARSVEQADIDALRETRFELDQLRAKAKSRFGGGAAREKVGLLEANHARILQRMGFESYEEFELWRTDTRPTSTIDPAILEFAKRELAEAERAWQQIQSLEIPEPEPVEPEFVDEPDPLDGAIPFSRPAAS